MGEEWDRMIYTCSVCQTEVRAEDLNAGDALERMVVLSPLHPLIQLDAELRRLGAR